MADIFLAYRREDQERVRRFHDALNELGFDVAWDQKILTGDAWEEWILEQLIGSRVVIVCWSSGSIKSDYVKKEARLAKNGNKLLPIYIEQLSAVERASLMGFDSLQNTDLSHWDGDPDDPVWLEFVRSVEHAITPTYLERKLRNLQAEIHALQVVRKGVSDREAELEKRLIEVSSAHSEALSRARVAESERDSAQEKLNRLESLTDKHQSASEQAGAQLQSLRAKYEDLEQKEKKTEEAFAKARDDAQALRQTNRSLEQSLSTAKRRLERLQNKRRRIFRLNAVRMAAIAAVVVGFSFISFFTGGRLSDSPELIAKLDEANARISSLEQTVADKDRAIGQQKEAVAGLRRRNADLVEENETLKARVRRAESERAHARQLLREVGVEVEDKVADATRRLQRKLLDLGAYTGAIDGKLGRMSWAALSVVLPEEGSSDPEKVLTPVVLRDPGSWLALHYSPTTHDVKDAWDSRDEDPDTYIRTVNKVMDQLQEKGGPTIDPPIYKPIIINDNTLPFEIRRRFPSNGMRAEIKMRVDPGAYPDFRIQNFSDSIRTIELRDLSGNIIFAGNDANEYPIRFREKSEARDYILALEQDPTKGKNIFLFIYVPADSRG